MQFKKTALATVAAVSSTAYAANSTSSQSVASGCSLGTSATATAQADLDKIASCTELVGNLTITGSLGSAALANVKKIDGSLRLYNATDLVNFSADSLTIVTGGLTLEDLTVLASASFGSLQQVDSIILQTLPAISTFSTNLQKANNIQISDTTLESVDGFSTLKEVSELNINNNRYLSSFNSSLESVSDSLQISFNGESTQVSFNELVWANNITLRDVEQATFPKLQTVNASLGFINNTLSNITLNKLTKVGQTFSVTSNEDLTVLECKNLTSIGGGFVVANNTNLQKIDGFSNVQTVGGAVIVTGEFSSLDLSSLKSVRGDATIETNASNFSCSAIKKLQSNGAIQGDSFVCKNGAVSSSSSSAVTSSTKSGSKTSSSSKTASSDSNSSSSSSSKSKGMAAQDFIPVNSVMGAIAAAAIALL
ncbi:similar to Saccharomyces cerevisiae YDR055W PST1 Cell wall protein that contains a putative GPI-attachment site [Maudiozyma barnettii]|nr:similar to Saccharomyces cerevisiae YDR055W PST1 Cell wall protein that contains a putative GPI-attachment site [Kazachstania barnettii]